MTIKKIGLSTLLFSAVLLTAGAATQVQAHAANGDSTTPTTKTTTDSTDTATHGGMPGTTYAVWTSMPDRAGYNNVITLTADENTTYPIFDPQGVSLEKVLNGQTSYSVDQLQLSLQPRNPNDSKDYNTAGLFARTSTSEWVKVAGPDVKDIDLDAGNGTLTNNDGGLNPTNFVINFTDQNGKDAQAPLVLPISTPQPGDQPSVLGSDMTDMVHTLQADLTQTHYDIPGYTLRDNDPVTSDGFTTTIHYIKNADPVKPGGGGNSSSSTNTSSSSSSASESSTADKPATKPVAVKGEAVYATKAIGLYQTPNFTKPTRKHFYTKESRTKRPQFVVTGYAQSKNGTLRYKVRDVNHTKATDKLRGYITANNAYVESTYYQSTPKRIKVLSRHGLNAYKTASLTGKSQRHYTRGTVLKVKAVKSYHLTNRFVLPNGHYVSANKVLVIKK
ncbi:DUF5776 domain-containing protein [Levilactobacillus yonginensis]